MDDRLVGEEKKGEDIGTRPDSFESYIGQEKAMERIKMFVYSAKKNNIPLSHVIIDGAPGLGKTTLCKILAKELGVNMVSFPSDVKKDDMDFLIELRSLKDGDILFIDEIQNLSAKFTDTLHESIDFQRLRVSVKEGNSITKVSLDLNKFTLVGATTRKGSLTPAFLSRFGIHICLDYYSPAELQKIVQRSASILGIKITDEACLEIGSRSRGTPRIANRLLDRTRDYATYHSIDTMDVDTAKKALDFLGINSLGMDDVDEKIMKVLINNKSGYPMSLASIATMISEEIETVRDVYEPYLMRLGLLEICNRGRKLTDKAYSFYGIERKIDISKMRL